MSQDNIVQMEPAATALRARFLAWQCKLRQIAMRQDGGRPSPGMVPRLEVAGSDQALDRITVLVNPEEPDESVIQLQFFARQTADPEKRYNKAVQYLSAEYYQRPETFSDTLTALFGDASPTAHALATAGRCVLTFEQFSQRFRIPCRTRRLGRSEPLFQLTHWHNVLFNPRLPKGVQVVAFQPEWSRSQAEAS
ncbi:MAG: hypothetical protein RIE31_10335 [Alphaproteobacteria bacterium]